MHPFVTPHLAGAGGVLKERAGDFLVEETPLYDPCGSGEHLYLFIEKTNLTTDEALKLASRAFGVSRGAFGIAGLKDKLAVTRQWISIHLPGVKDSDAARAIEKLGEKPESLRVLKAARHGNKLRLGHHGGNRFILKIRQVDPIAAVRARPILDFLVKHGAPDFVGQQRFGHDGDGAELGRQLLLGTAPPEVRRQRPDQKAFLISAFQSAVFNRTLAMRVEAGNWNQLLVGDLALKHANGSLFVVDETVAQTENAIGGRGQTMEVSPSGPLWGESLMRTTGEPDEIEIKALAEFGFTPETLVEACKKLGGDNTRGARRPLRIQVSEPSLLFSVDEFGPFLQIAFMLQKGAFATEVMREIMKVRESREKEPRA